MTTENEHVQTLNLEVLYYIVQGSFADKINNFEPKELDIDLKNLAHEGYIIYDGDVSRIVVTDAGLKALDIVMEIAEKDVVSEIKESVIKEV